MICWGFFQRFLGLLGGVDHQFGKHCAKDAVYSRGIDVGKNMLISVVWDRLDS